MKEKHIQVTNREQELQEKEELKKTIVSFIDESPEAHIICLLGNGAEMELVGVANRWSMIKGTAMLLDVIEQNRSDDGAEMLKSLLMNPSLRRILKNMDVEHGPEFLRNKEEDKEDE